MARSLPTCALCLLAASFAVPSAVAQTTEAPAWGKKSFDPFAAYGSDFDFSGALQKTEYDRPDNRVVIDPWATHEMVTPEAFNAWHWQWLPDGILYPAYLAGRLESRMSTVWMVERDTNYWDSTLGGRVGVIRYGNTSTTDGAGWQLDMEGAAMVRLNLDNNNDVDNADFRFGIPLTYACGSWQVKFAYYHLSSHLGDEFIARTPGATGNNYNRDGLVFGVGYYPHPDWRLYAETGWAFSRGGGADPFEFQFGVDYSPVEARDFWGSPFFAFNGHLREDVDFGGNFVVQAGWQRRGTFNDRLFRIGLQYFNGKSTAFQFFRMHEEQLGFGLWYDY